MKNGYLFCLKENDLIIDPNKKTCIQKINGVYTKRTKFLKIEIQKEIKVLEVLKFLSVGVHEIVFNDGTKIEIDPEKED